MDEELKRNAERIRELVGQNKIVMNRVPSNTQKRFYEIANEEDFCEDYGMALKHLIDVYDGIVITGADVLSAEISALSERLEALEASQKQEEKTSVTMADGTKRKVK